MFRKPPWVRSTTVSLESEKDRANKVDGKSLDCIRKQVTLGMKRYDATVKHPSQKPVEVLWYRCLSPKMSRNVVWVCPNPLLEKTQLRSAYTHTLNFDLKYRNRGVLQIMRIHTDRTVQWHGEVSGRQICTVYRYEIHSYQKIILRFLFVIINSCAPFWHIPVGNQKYNPA